jgi:hypothetical protein
MMTPPEKQHQWLRHLVGEWAIESECIPGPDQPPAKTTATETVRMLGDLWVVAEGRGEMPGGGQMSWVMTIGYDTNRKKFVGSWIGSCMTTMFVYEADLDTDEKRLPLTTSGPSFADPTKIATYEDIIEIHSPDHRTLTSQVRNDDGTWTRFLTAHYRRVRQEPSTTSC